MNPKQAISDLQKNKVWPVYYLFGEEPFKIHQFTGKMGALWIGEKRTNYEKIDGAQSTGLDVLNTLQSMGLFSGPRRVVLVKSAHQLKGIEALAKEVMNLKTGEDPWGGNLFVMVAESLDGRKKFHQWIKKNGFALEFKRATDAELFEWIGILAKKNKLEITQDAAKILALRSDGALYRLSSEVEKAWLIAGGHEGARIDFEDVMKTASSHITREMIELVNAVVSGFKTRALILCDQLIDGSEAALGFVGFLNWAIKNTPLSLKQRENFLDKLIEVDCRLKSSGSEPRSVIEQFIVSVLRDRSHPNMKPTALEAE